MDHRRTSSYRRLRTHGPWAMRWHALRRQLRLDPAWPWWAIWIAGATAVAGLLDLAGLVRWWVGPPLGLLLAVLVLGLTALDDVRRPLASLRVLRTELREPPWASPGRADAVRAAAFDIPLFAPPPAAATAIRLSGGGASYGRGLLSPAQPRLRVSWRWTTRDEPAFATTLVDTGDRPGTGTRWLYDGQVRSHPSDDPEGRTELRIDVDEVRRQDARLAVVLDGSTHRAEAADLQRWGAGWAATLRLDERHRLDLCGGGALPERLELVRWDPEELVDESPRAAPGHS